MSKDGAMQTKCVAKLLCMGSYPAFGDIHGEIVEVTVRHASNFVQDLNDSGFGCFLFLLQEINSTLFNNSILPIFVFKNILKRKLLRKGLERSKLRIVLKIMRRIKSETTYSWL